MAHRDKAAYIFIELVKLGKIIDQMLDDYFPESLRIMEFMYYLITVPRYPMTLYHLLLFLFSHYSATRSPLKGLLQGLPAFYFEWLLEFARTQHPQLQGGFCRNYSFDLVSEGNTTVDVQPELLKGESIYKLKIRGDSFRQFMKYLLKEMFALGCIPVMEYESLVSSYEDVK